MNHPIIFELEDGVATLLVNRPEARNALNWEAQEQFAKHVVDVSKDDQIRALIITGSGDAFVSGGDLKELAARPDPDAGERLNSTMSVALAQLTELPIPVMAAVNGHAVGGGCEILTACDLRIARADVHLKFAQIQMGLTTGWGGAARLVRLVGQSRAMELLLTGRPVGAREAQGIGLLHRLTEPEQDVLEAARTWARELVALPREALAAMKNLLYALPDLSLEQQVTYEQALFTRLWGRPDHVEAMNAFVEKRAPVFNRGQNHHQ